MSALRCPKDKGCLYKYIYIYIYMYVCMYVCICHNNHTQEVFGLLYLPGSDGAHHESQILIFVILIFFSVNMGLYVDFFSV